MLLRLSLVLGVLLCSACAPQPHDCARPEVFCAGLVTDFGPVSTGIPRDTWLGLQDAKSAHLLDRVDSIETVDSRDRAANIAVFSQAGYDLIVTVGATMLDETKAAAAAHPELLFVGVEQSQDTILPNLSGLVFHEDYSGYLAGALAARVSQTHHVAAVCEAHFIDAMRRYCEGFRAGARAIQPDIDVTVDYREGSDEGLFNDAGWGEATALRQIRSGADVLFAAGGGTAEGALQAASDSGALVIGAESDQYYELEGVRPRLLTSAVNDVRAGILEMVRRARQGQFPAGDYTGAAMLAPWHDTERLIPTQVQHEIYRLGLSLQTGEIQVDIPYQSP